MTRTASGAVHPGQAAPEIRLADAVASEAPGDVGEDRRGGDDLLGVAAGAAGAGPGVGHVQAVQEVDFRPLGPEPAGQIEQPQRPGEVIIGREVVNPGVDEEQTRARFWQLDA